METQRSQQYSLAGFEYPILGIFGTNGVNGMNFQSLKPGNPTDILSEVEK